MYRFVFALLMTTVLLPVPALAEGTWQLGANQDFKPSTKFRVDILKAGEVINIAAGINTDDYPKPLLVHVKDPAGKNVANSPFTISKNTKGWLAGHGKLPPAIITNPLQVVTKVAGTHSITFDNQNLTWIDPLDITVTKDTKTAVVPASPPGGLGRLHTVRWSIRGPDYTAKTSPRYYVLVPTGGSTDYTWLMEFNGLSGRIYDVIANPTGLNPPDSGYSDTMAKVTSPLGSYEIYLHPPALAKGGTIITPNNGIIQ